MSIKNNRKNSSSSPKPLYRLLRPLHFRTIIINRDESGRACQSSQFEFPARILPFFSQSKPPEALGIREHTYTIQGVEKEEFCGQKNRKSFGTWIDGLAFFLWLQIDRPNTSIYVHAYVLMYI